jgi:hypothetical protein
MPASVAPSAARASARRRITEREFWTALAWAISYEAFVWGLGVALRPVLIALGAPVVIGIGLTWLWYALALPASLLAPLLGPSDAWQPLVGLVGLDIMAATGFALLLVHRRARTP